MGWIRCLTSFSTLMSTLIVLFTLQYISGRNPVFLVLVVTFSIFCSISLGALLYNLQLKARECVNPPPKKPPPPPDDPETGDAHGAGGGALLGRIPGIPTRFRFSELFEATGGFAQKLGKGGSGSVYSGKLLVSPPAKAIPIAVKKLDNDENDGGGGSDGQEGDGDGGGYHMKHKEFRSEVLTISGLHHLNLVRLLGFCSEGPHRLLVYEHMDNGSLDRWLFQPPSNTDTDTRTNTITKTRTDTHTDTNAVLTWDIRFRIALETGRALAYLHGDCREQILHLDIKPQNILLDAEFHAKLSDFGLARSIKRSESESSCRLVTTMRGTPGYLAPEWLLNAGVTDKCDVYSFGMVLLELVSGRRNVDHSQDSENWYFPAIAFQKAQERRILDILDPSLRPPPDPQQVTLVTQVAFWCVQRSAKRRPSMAMVVKMLEGSEPVPEAPLSGVFSFSAQFLHNLMDTTNAIQEVANGDGAKGGKLEGDTITSEGCGGESISMSYNTTRSFSHSSSPWPPHPYPLPLTPKEAPKFTLQQLLTLPP